MGKLHEVLAAERTVVGASDKMIEETRQKFGKYEHYLTGHIKTLKMVDDSEAAKAMERAARQHKELPTTVLETLEYALEYWAKAEDVLATKNVANQSAVADVEVDGNVLLTDVPVDELMGLEARLQVLRGVVQMVPTQDASKSWVLDESSSHKGAYKQATPDVTTKTEKVTTPVVLYDATKEHPAQVKEISKDVVVGTFEQFNWSGAATAFQKAEMLSRIDRLLVEVKKARTRANQAQVVETKFGKVVVDFMLSPLYAK